METKNMVMNNFVICTVYAQYYTNLDHLHLTKWNRETFNGRFQQIPGQPAFFVWGLLHVLTSPCRACGFHVSAEECTIVILANMVTNKAGIKSKIIFCHIINSQLNTIILANLNSCMIVWINKLV